MSETKIEYGNDSLAIIEKSKAFRIFDARSFNESGELALELARAIKQTKANWNVLVEKAKASYDETKASRDSELKPLEDMAGHVSAMRVTWKVEQDRMARVEQERLQKIERDKAEAERQKLLEKAVVAKTQEKSEALLEKAEQVYEKPVFVAPVIEKTTKMESGGTITWIRDIKVTVINPKLVCEGILKGFIPIGCVEFKGLKAFAKMGNIKGEFWGLLVEDDTRESKRI